MRYVCMCFGWYQELLNEVRVEGLAAAESEILRMLDSGGMIVHAYRESDPDNPELVGRHRRLQSFFSADESSGVSKHGILPHEVERFLLDASNLEDWKQANKTQALLDHRWSVVDLWTMEGTGPACLYGKATLVAPVSRDLRN